METVVTSEQSAIDTLKESNSNADSAEPFVEDEGLSFYSKLKNRITEDDETDTVTHSEKFSETKESDVPSETRVHESAAPIPTASPTPNPFATAQPGFKNGFIVQVSSVRKKAYADETLKKLTDNGFPAYISKIRYNTGIVNYRVRIGPYTNRKAANTIEDRVKKELHYSPLVMQISENNK
jgi:cell division septation protein DedD